jgi:hypothetical protein
VAIRYQTVKVGSKVIKCLNLPRKKRKKKEKKLNDSSRYNFIFETLRAQLVGRHHLVYIFYFLPCLGFLLALSKEDTRQPC